MCLSLKDKYNTINEQHSERLLKYNTQEQASTQLPFHGQKYVRQVQTLRLNLACN